ncbi:HET-domain-containing protein [Byssothecium circinans]|uniref:HET-domain-containing protein n=1 Tax=Byssothecium circinans TaxID=147558 RepID=A0A6A5TSJ5_9PLEO|nr:HET-domain-containing protein [Byssothecium circinans]
MSQEQTLKTAKPPQVQPRHLEHEPLRDGCSARYLILQPASTISEPLVCTLHSAHLNNFPPFEAISYVWGTLVKNQPMICNGKDIRITANLSAALLQIRFKNKPRTLWVDSICINQADPEELGYQVSLMGVIYKKSNCTLICLGPSDHGHATIVEGLVTDVDYRVQCVFGRADANSFPFPDENDPLLSHSGWTSFGVLLQQPWFRRGWVVQEAALSRDAVVRWGDTDINWLKLVRTYIYFERLWLTKLHLQGFHSRRNCEAITFQSEGAVESLSLLEILDSARWLDVTDPRDRIYAFLSLLELNNTKMHLLSVQPNYTVPYIHVYRDFALEYLRKFEDLDILHFLHNDNSTLECELTSWIPRWNLRLYSGYAGTLNNHSRSSRRITSQLSPSSITVSADQTTLRLQIMILDTVMFTGEAFIKNFTKPYDVASLWECISTRSTPLPYSCSALRAFVETFRCGVYRGRLKEWKTLESAYIRMLQREIFQGDAAYDDAKSFHEMRMEDVHNRCFIMSSRGYYGLAPKAVREGDLCCIIFGTRSPFILRRTDSAGHYKLVGSLLILSRELDHNGCPGVLGSDKKYEDWAEWGLKEEDAFLR